jgi:hypothetical protein
VAVFSIYDRTIPRYLLCVWTGKDYMYKKNLKKGGGAFHKWYLMDST